MTAVHQRQCQAWLLSAMLRGTTPQRGSTRLPENTVTPTPPMVMPAFTLLAGAVVAGALVARVATTPYPHSSAPSLYLYLYLHLYLYAMYFGQLSVVAWRPVLSGILR